MNKIDGKMRIAWVHSHFHYWMGGTKFILEVVKRLHNKAFVEIFIQNGRPEVIRKFMEAGIHVNNLNTRSTTSPLFWMGLPFFCSRDAGKLQTMLDNGQFDVVISSMFPMNHIATRLKNKRIYQYCYEPFAFFWDPHLRRTLPLQDRVITAVLAVLYGRKDVRATQKAIKIFTLSEVTRRQIQQTYNRDSIITYEGVDLDFFKRQSDSTLDARYKDDFVVLHCTDFTPIKRTDLAVKICARLKTKIQSAKLLITSTCENPVAQKKISALAEKEGLHGSDIEFLGFVPHHLLPAYYSLAKILLQPAINQPQSLPVKEALACQTPVARGYAEEVEFSETDGLGIIINPLDIEGSANKIYGFLAENVFYGQKAREFVKKKFNWDKIADIMFSNLST